MENNDAVESEVGDCKPILCSGSQRVEVEMQRTETTSFVHF